MKLPASTVKRIKAMKREDQRKMAAKAERMREKAKETHLIIKYALNAPLPQ